jgi:hypothetical protein
MSGFKPIGALTPDQEEAVDSIVNLPDNAIPKAVGGELVTSSTTENPTTEEWLFNKSIEVPQASVKISDTLSISEATLLPITRDRVLSESIVSVGSAISETLGSSRLNFQHVPSGQVIVAQPDFGTALTSNPLIVPLLATRSNQTDIVTLRTGAPMTNFRATIVDNLTGIILKYIPTKEAVDSGIGLNLPVGDVVFNFNSDLPDNPAAGLFYLGFTPLRQIAVQASTFTVMADSVNILGEPGGIPYIVNEIHFLENTTVPFTEDVTNVADSYSRLNNEYGGLSGTTGGNVVTYLATAIADEITLGQFTVGEVAVSNPTVETDNPAVFSQGDFVQINDTVLNDGLYEVESHISTLLTLRGIGTVANVEDFTATNFITTKDSGTVTKVNVSIMRSDIDGIWEYGKGSVSGVEFSKVGIENGTIERVLNANSIAANQVPTGLGPVNAIQIEFGAAQFGPTDPVSIDVNGSITFNQTGLYRIKISAQIGRSGAGGVSELLVRALIGGVQAGRTVAAKLDNANVIIPYSDEAWLNIPATTVLSYELMRDSSGANSGGLVGQDVTVEAGSWEQDVCSELRIERWRS